MKYGTLNLSRTATPGKNRIIYQIETTPGEFVTIVQDVYEVIGGQARIAINAPACVRVMRGEIATVVVPGNSI